jgi:hypothetical protein
MDGLSHTHGEVYPLPIIYKQIIATYPRKFPCALAALGLVSTTGAASTFSFLGGSLGAN